MLLLYKSCAVFVRSFPSLFELTYMMLQNNCINNVVTNSLKENKKKNMQTVLYDKIKKRRDEWFIGANTQNLPYLSIGATQDKTRQRPVRRLLRRVKVHRRADM